jgi:hypothetical protein
MQALEDDNANRLLHYNPNSTRQPRPLNLAPNFPTLPARRFDAAQVRAFVCSALILPLARKGGVR